MQLYVCADYCIASACVSFAAVSSFQSIYLQSLLKSTAQHRHKICVYVLGNGLPVESHLVKPVVDQNEVIS